MSKNSFTQMSENLLNQGGQGGSASQGGNSLRIIYPAIVRSTEDRAGYGRIKAEIVTMDEKGVLVPGKDKDTEVDKLPLCIPVMPEFFHIRPQVGECVLVFCENPSDMSSPRYYFGPLINSQARLPFQSYQDSVSIFDRNTYSKGEIFSSSTHTKNSKTGALFPSQTEVALQGRSDADIIFKPREVVLIAGKFALGTFEKNATTPCRIQLKQVDAPTNLTGIKVIDDLTLKNFKAYSQTNIEGTNINLISVEGKFRSFDANHPENSTNPRLKDFGDTATKLHPLVFGDELIVLLRLILTYLTTHVHTPQSPAVPNAVQQQLLEYLSGGKMQSLLSNHVRTN